MHQSIPIISGTLSRSIIHQQRNVAAYCRGRIHDTGRAAMPKATKEAFEFAAIIKAAQMIINTRLSHASRLTLHTAIPADVVETKPTTSSLRALWKQHAQIQHNFLQGLKKHRPSS